MYSLDKVLNFSLFNQKDSSFGQAAAACRQCKDLKQKLLADAEQLPPEAALHSPEMRELCPQYKETDLNYLRRNESNLNAECYADSVFSQSD